MTFHEERALNDALSASGSISKCQVNGDLGASIGFLMQHKPNKLQIGRASHVGSLRRESFKLDARADGFLSLNLQTNTGKIGVCLPCNQHSAAASPGRVVRTDRKHSLL